MSGGMNKMPEGNIQNEEPVVFISYKLEGRDAERFQEFKRRMNIKNTSEAARKALFDQIDQIERQVA
jgi:hypothetical protein